MSLALSVDSGSPGGSPRMEQERRVLYEDDFLGGVCGPGGYVGAALCLQSLGPWG